MPEPTDPLLAYAQTLKKAAYVLQGHQMSRAAELRAQRTGVVTAEELAADEKFAVFQTGTFELLAAAARYETEAGR